MNIIEQFRNIYFSKKNIDYIHNYVLNKLKKEAVEIKEENETYNILHPILSSIFESYEQIITNEFIQTNGNINHEDILIRLNKMAMVKFESSLQQPTIPTNNVREQMIDEPFHLDYNNQEVQTEKTNLHNSETQTEQIIDEIRQNNYGVLHHIFSEDAEYITDDGVFVFNMKIKNVNQMTIKSFRVQTDMYNIQINNNTFVIIENGVQMKISIPIGYYNLENLLDIINKILVRQNSNCILEHDKIKNRISIKNNSNKFKNFDVILNSSDMISIGEMLGFTLNEYHNNSIYVAEKLPGIELFNDLYLRLFTNGEELKRVKSTKEDFSYFSYFCINNIENFGQVFYTEPEQKIFLKSLDITEFSCQLLCNPYIPISSNISFEFVLYFD